ncbi:MAG: ribonuclease HII [Rhizobiaceae bacterium]
MHRTDSPQPNLLEQPKHPDFKPDFSFESELLKQKLQNICGIDEVGRGPLAGPVTAAAVILDPNNIPNGLHDSKKLTEAKREELFIEIMETSHVAISNISARIIDEINIRNASLLAMRIAAKGLSIFPCHALIDGNALPVNMPCPATTIIKGDARSLSIAAASIVAKVTRDRLMVRVDKKYYGFGLAKHKGYPTKEHRCAIKEHGPCALHRRSFRPVAAALLEPEFF